MIILDASAVIAALTGEPGQRAIAEILRGEEPAALTATGVAEVVDHMVRVRGAELDRVLSNVEELGLATPVPVSERTGLGAGSLRAKYYDRATSAVSLADCLNLQAAIEHGGAVASSDRQLLDVCQAERVGVFPLPNSAGETWDAPIADHEFDYLAE
ncbi:MAG TPA: PIN domain-containing protein [Ilumatobacter sp.]|nr:PIN domain-containing protein [Ilumatobacter sp.]